MVKGNRKVNTKDVKEIKKVENKKDSKKIKID